MILLFGGTTEGRICVEVLDEAGTPFYYSTKGTEQQVESRNGIRLTGAMEKEEMINFCIQHEIRLIVDAAHPFATHLHSTIAHVGALCEIPTVRYERKYPELLPNDILCSSYTDAIDKMFLGGVKRLLALTGVKTISSLKRFWIDSTKECYFRILNRDESFTMAEHEGFKKENLLLYSKDNVKQLIEAIKPDAIITKESGESGGFREKQEAASQAGIALYVVKRPNLPKGFITVTGRHGLRRTIEKNVTGFYTLRTGFTTGSCATASAKAALLALQGKISIGKHEISFELPDGEIMKMITDVIEVGNGYAIASAIKDAGDDPDIIHNHEIRVRVEYAPNATERFSFLKGVGVGIVTLPGLDIPIGEPAINKTPKMMIRNNLSKLYDGSLNIIISIPDGEQLARNTFNPKIGIIGGLSIIGTSGIVKPFSADAFADALKREMEVAVAMGSQRIVLNSGAKSEVYVKKQYPSLPSQAFIHYGNFIGRSLEAAKQLGIKNITLGSMIGKAVKLAAGNLDTHSKNVVIDRSFLSQLARDAGCSNESISVIEGVNLARELWTSLSSTDLHLFTHAIAVKCHHHCKSVFNEGSLTFLLIDENGEIREEIN